MKHALLNAIEQALLLGYNVHFTKDMPMHFQIKVEAEKSAHSVTLPIADHLNEEKMAKYVTMLTNTATIESNQLVKEE